MQEVCLVIPCYNEEKRLKGDDLLDFLKAHERAAVCLVNDGSSDGTQRVLDGLRQQDPKQILVLDLARNGGKAEAVRQGVLHASSKRRFAFIGYWDADLSTPLDELDGILGAFEASPGCQLAMGSRVKRLGSDIKRRASRHVLGRIFSTFSSGLLQLPVYDSQCGAKVFRSDLAEILFSEPFVSKWIFDVEILARLRNHLGRDRALSAAIEVPLKAWKEMAGSKLRLAHMVKAPLDLLRIHSHYGRTR